MGYDEAPQGISLDEGVAVYVAGWHRSTSTSDYDGFLTKRSLTDGASLWSAAIEESPPSTAGPNDYARGVSAKGFRVHVVGGTYGNLEGMNLGGQDAFLRKYDSSGTQLWTRQFGTASDDEAIGVAQDETGIYVVGFTAGTLQSPPYGGIDGFIRKYDHVGNHLWTRQFGTVADDKVFGVTLAGDLFVAGQTTGTFPQQPSFGQQDIFVQRWDLLGNHLWTRQFGTAGADLATGTAGTVAAGDPNAVYVAGLIPEQPPSGALLDSLLRKYDGLGNEVWTQQIATGGQVRALVADGSGVSLVGDGLTTGEPPVVTYAAPFVRRYDTLGSLRWTLLLSLEYNSLYAVAGRPSTGLYAAGTTDGNDNMLTKVQMDDSPTACFRRSPAPPTVPKVGQPVEFDAICSTDPEGGPLSYEWDFDGDGVYEGSGVRVVHTYWTYASYTVRLRVSDGINTATSPPDQFTITNGAPTACFYPFPESTRIGQTVAFDASCSSDPNGDALTYAWTFGDSGTGTGIRVTHTYTAYPPNPPGYYTVTLTVSDVLSSSPPATRQVTLIDGVPVGGIVVDLSGELDYKLGESIQLQFFAVVRDSATGGYVLGATVIIDIYKPDGTKWMGPELMTELSPGPPFVGTPGVYRWRSVGPIQLSSLGLGIWHARVLATYATFQSSDAVQFHVDPPGESPDGVPSPIPLGEAAAISSLLGVAIVAWRRRQIAEKIRRINRR